MNDKRTSGIGVPGLLLVAFIILKLCHVISWPWVWVLSPLWISLIIGVICVVIIEVVKAKQRW